MMFQVGDKILYPMYGVGIIDGIEEKEVLGSNRLYYSLNIPQIKMHILIPLDKMASLGIRHIVEQTTLEDVLRSFQHGNTDPIIYENQRYCTDINKKRIKSGDIYKETEVIRDLVRKGQKSKLGKQDVTMLNDARQMFVSELMQVKGITKEQATCLLDEVSAVIQ